MLFGVAFDLVNRKPLDEEDAELGEEDDLLFFRFGFLGIFGSSLGGRSENISDTGWWPKDCSKSERKKKYLEKQVSMMSVGNCHKLEHNENTTKNISRNLSKSICTSFISYKLQIVTNICLLATYNAYGKTV